MQALSSLRKHASERVLRCWGGSGSGLAVENTKIIKLLEEYDAGRDLGEACQCIRDLDIPFFHHEGKEERPFIRVCTVSSWVSPEEATKGISSRWELAGYTLCIDGSGERSAIASCGEVLVFRILARAHIMP
ncbi:hypothetical protein R1flu_009282 [Riccia fluitans]|uniref:MI domain-containing protein n=1 Tax=Riccia fluitans TaxID=41844 RepID=A0ABD1Z1W3_9MARC